MKRAVPYRYGKRYEKRKKKLNKKKFIIAIICIIILAIILISYINRDNKNVDVQADTEEKENIMNTANIQIDSSIGVEDDTIGSDLPEKIGNYTVIGELVIDKIGVKNSILDRTDDTSLNLSVTKFYGPNGINHAGNFCIIGHNYSQFLKRLKEMEKGDTFYVVNKQEHTKVTYQIYDMYTCQPTDLKCIEQNEDGKKEVTLITCNPGGLTRLICKAKEV